MIHEHEAAAGTTRLRIALGAAIFVFVLELAGGFYAGSLALLADSAHVFMDVVALVIALVAGIQALRPPTERQTYGFARFEILAALLNGGLLFAVTIVVAIEAVQRLAHPQAPDGPVMLGVAAFGLAINLVIGVMLARSADTNLNLRAVIMHVFGDALGGIGVIIAAIAVIAFGALWADPVVSLFVGVIIVFGVLRITREAADVLLESAPRTAQTPLVRERIRELANVSDVHDVHVWSIGSDVTVLTAHILLPDGEVREATAILRTIEAAMLAEFAINHVTIQFECETCAPNDRIVCAQQPARPVVRA